MPHRYVALAGNIGVGKSTLTAFLAEAVQATPVFEAVAENPYLADFYADMQRWGFHSQVFFLSRRLRQHFELLAQDGAVVQDRSLYEDAEIFARNLYLSGNLTERDWRTYEGLYAAARDALRPPDVIIYLQASVPTLRARIATRGRDYEKGLTDDYLARLNTLYESWAASFTAAPVVTVPTDGLDFVGKPEDKARVLAELKKLAGL